jgi:hypothetical protein
MRLNVLWATDFDLLFVGNCVLSKEQQNVLLAVDYKKKYELD